eukprot:6459780-Amphidinium_carterae.1
MQALTASEKATTCVNSASARHIRCTFAIGPYASEARVWVVRLWREGHQVFGVHAGEFSVVRRQQQCAMEHYSVHADAHAKPANLSRRGLVAGQHIPVAVFVLEQGLL